MSDRPPERGSPPEELNPLGAAATIAGGGRGGSPRAKDRDGRRRLPVGLALVVIVVAVVLLGLVPALGSVLAKTPRDRVGISYGGGPIEGAHFQRIVQPGSSLFINGLADNLYLYPSDQQNYIVSKVVGQGSTDESDSIVAPTKEGVQVEYQVAAFFKLNIDRLRAFHEQLGLKYRAYTSSGWADLITDTFRQQIENALQAETRRYTVAELVGDVDVLNSLQSSVQAKVFQQLVATLGQPFFCGPTYQLHARCGPITFAIKKIDIPKGVQEAFNAVSARTYEAQSIEILNASLEKAGQNYVLLRAIEEGVAKIYVVPVGTGVDIVAPADDTSPTTTAPSEPSGTTSTTTTTAPTTSPGG